MEKFGNNISDARRRVTTLAIMARWIWVVNSVVGLVSITYHRFDIAALAAFTWVLSLVAAALGHSAANYLGSVERTIRTS